MSCQSRSERSVRRPEASPPRVGVCDTGLQGILAGLANHNSSRPLVVTVPGTPDYPCPERRWSIGLYQALIISAASIEPAEHQHKPAKPSVGRTSGRFVSNNDLEVWIAAKS